jgi:hypothetical protein
MYYFEGDLRGWFEEIVVTVAKGKRKNNKAYSIESIEPKIG